MQLKHSTINKQILVSPHDRVGGPGVRRAMDMRLGEEDEQGVGRRNIYCYTFFKVDEWEGKGINCMLVDLEMTSSQTANRGN